MAVTREAAGRGVCERAGASTPAMWLSDHTHLDAGVARSVVKLSTALVETRPATQAALGQGALSAAHARVITEVVAKLPVQAGSPPVAQAEVFLVEHAALLCPRDLAGVGRELHERIAGDFPSVDDLAEAAAMEAAADEAAWGAWERRGLDVYERPGGEVGITASLAGDDAAALVTWLDAASQPDAADDGVVDERTATQRRADALGSLVSATLDAGTLPAQDGNHPQVILTVRLETLQRMARTAAREQPGQPGEAALDTGAALAPGDLRRVLCDARITPVVMGGPSEPLDVGRQQRLVTTAMRKARTARDRGCAWPGCQSQQGSLNVTI